MPPPTPNCAYAALDQGTVVYIPALTSTPAWHSSIHTCPVQHYTKAQWYTYLPSRALRQGTVVYLPALTSTPAGHSSTLTCPHGHFGRAQYSYNQALADTLAEYGNISTTLAALVH